ncbi:MAG: tetratricopeptide repeat protein [Simkania sp.]|nr:tetratricopeptide repeat protein [Simkania sp.]
MNSILLSLALLTTSLDPLSVEEHLAYYKLYPETNEGKKALRHAWKLLGEGAGITIEKVETLPNIDIEAMVSLITRESYAPPPHLTPSQLAQFNKISAFLPNRKLKGASIWSKEDILALSDEEVDLSRALLIHQFEDRPSAKDDILQYEAILDLMALEIRARLPTWATDLEKIDMINRFIFEEKRYRFPPHSLYAKEIDLYTFLPSVLDSREGVCLGVSILYLTIAQRLGLSLEIITPPGHIYLRYKTPEGLINIETTARGINLPSETYLGINTRTLQQRTIKEVIALSFINQAAVAWEQGKHAETIKLYEKALPYLPKDSLLQMLLGLNYLFVGQIQKGRELLTPLKALTFDFSVSPETIPSDYLEGKTNVDGIKAVFTHVDETRDSVLHKLATMEKVIDKYPRFRAGLLQLAVCHLQLGHGTEALKVLEQYHAIDPHDATVEYYLAALYLERFDIPKAWLHFLQTEKLVSARQHNPKSLKPLKNALLSQSPSEI